MAGGRARWLATSVGVAAVLGGLVLGPPAAASGESLIGITVAPGAVAVAGFGSVDVTLSVQMDLGSPVSPCEAGDIYNRFAGKPVVTLTRTAGATGVDDTVMVPLTTSPGAGATSGVWSGTWKVASPRSGTWTVTQVFACTESNSPAGWQVDPRTQGVVRTLTVEGTNVPRISVSTSTVVYGATAITVRAWLRDGSGAPVVGRQVAFGGDNMCGVDGDSGALASTGANGVASMVTDPGQVLCVYVTTPPAASLRLDTEHALVFKRFITPKYLFSRVTATPGRTSLPRNAVLTVTGAVTPSGTTLGYPVTVTLYRQVGPSSYRAVGSATARASGRYTATTRPQARGSFFFKAVATSTRPGMVPTASARFRVRVT